MMFQSELLRSIKSGESKLYTQSIFDTFGQHFKQDKKIVHKYQILTECTAWIS